MRMTMMKTLSPCQSNMLSRSSLKPTSSNFKIFATANGTQINATVTHQIKDSKNGVLHFDFQERFLSRLPATAIERFLSRLPATAIVITNALTFTQPLRALAETCEADNSIIDMNMPVLLFVALVGATVGGLLARQRKGEMLRLNEQLRQINTALKRQAKIESYAPALSYAPVSGRIPENEVIIDPRKQDLISRLRNGKVYLRSQDPEKAFFEFKTALDIAHDLKDPIEEKKAARGLGASLQRQGKFWDAIKYHSTVLEISQRENEDSGNTEAYGAIADCYTELGDLERAAKFYDQYIERLQSD